MSLESVANRVKGLLDHARVALGHLDTWEPAGTATLDVCSTPSNIPDACLAVQHMDCDTWNESTRACDKKMGGSFPEDWEYKIAKDWTPDDVCKKELWLGGCSQDEFNSPGHREGGKPAWPGLDLRTECNFINTLKSRGYKNFQLSYGAVEEAPLRRAYAEPFVKTRRPELIEEIVRIMHGGSIDTKLGNLPPSRERTQLEHMKIYRDVEFSESASGQERMQQDILFGATGPTFRRSPSSNGFVLSFEEQGRIRTQ